MAVAEGYVQTMMHLAMDGRGEVVLINEDGSEVVLYSVPEYSDEYGVGRLSIIVDSTSTVEIRGVRTWGVMYAPSPIGTRFFEDERSTMAWDYPSNLRTVFVIMVLDGKLVYFGKISPIQEFMVPWDGLTW